MKESNTEIKIKRIQKVSVSQQKNIQELYSELSSSSKSITSRQIKKALSSKNTFVFCAFEKQVIVAMCTFISNITLAGIRIRIEDFVVSSRVRGKGIGSTLFKKVLSEAQKQKPVSIDLTSNPSRISAQALYRANGFTQRDTSVFRR